MRIARTGAPGPLAATLALVAALAPAPAAAATDPLRAQQWNLDLVGAPRAWPKTRGRGITIAIVDSGVDLTHADLRANLVAGHDFVDGGDPTDDCGHGTHVAGIAAAVEGNGSGIAGVAPGARIMPVRVLEQDGSGECTGSTSDVVAGIGWAVDHGARVINLSVGDVIKGLRGASAEFSTALDDAWRRGAIPVVAAGNDYILSSGYADDHALIVSATTREDRDATYSSGVGRAMWGISAPGGAGSLFCDAAPDIWSAWPEALDACGAPAGYETQAGTSMAAPHVAGAAALLLSLGLTPQRVVDRLLSTAKDLGPSGRDSTYGAGRLDIARAVSGLGASPSTPPTGAPPLPSVPAPPPGATLTPGPAESSPPRGSAPASPAVPTAAEPSPGGSAAAAPGGETPGPGSRTPVAAAAIAAVVAALFLSRRFRSLR